MECVVGGAIKLDIEALGTPKPMYQWFYQRSGYKSKLEYKSQTNKIILCISKLLNLLEKSAIHILVQL